MRKRKSANTDAPETKLDLSIRPDGIEIEITDIKTGLSYAVMADKTHALKIAECIYEAFNVKQPRPVEWYKSKIWDKQ